MLASSGRASSQPRLPTANINTTLREAMKTIEAGSASICLLLDSDQRLVATLSDGDVRRAFLGGATMESPVRPWATSEPKSVPAGTDRSAVLDLMQALTLAQIPEIDADGRVIRLHLLKEIVGGTRRKNRAVVLAGGRGTRLRSVTGGLPKPMVPVAGRPILERLVLHLVGSGITEVTLAIGHGADVIQQHFGDGSALGCAISYLREDEPQGTAGPLRGLIAAGIEMVGDEPLIVLNGDLVTSFSVSGLLDAHRAGDARLTIAVTDYVHEVPYGVLETDAGTGRVTALQEKPTWVGVVNAGVYALDPALIADIPADRAVPMTELIELCIGRGDTVRAWRVSGEWHDVGQPADLERARGV